MRKSIFLFALVLGLLPSLLVAQASEDVMTADQIIEKYAEAIGGAENWLAVKSMRVDGKMMTQGMDFPFVTTMSSPNKMRIDVNIMGQDMVQSFDGETAWQLSPMMGINAPTKMSEVEAKQVNQSELVPEFINYAERGYTVELVDEREIEGVATQGIRLTDGKEKDQTYYFDLENFVPIMMEVTAKDGPFKGASIENYLSDYQEVNGLMIPFFTEIRNPQGTMKMQFTKIELDVELADDFFSMPKE